MRHIHGSLLVGCSALALASCGPSDIASPGSGGNITINNPAPAPAPTPTSTGPAQVTAASACPSISSTRQLTDAGTLSGPTGTWRVCSLPAIVDRSVQLPKVAGLVYQLNGRVDVGCDGGFSAPSAAAPVASSTVGCTSANGFALNAAGQLTADTNVTLTIDPGVIVIGAPGASWLAVNRGNKINAVGTPAAPIIFTSRDNVTGQVSETSQGQWGGVVLMGRAPTTDCTTGTIAAGTCERQTEGATDPARFGGAQAGYDAGKMSFVQIRYSGFILSSNIELQSLTGEGVGTGTTIDHIMSYNSSDDGTEWFGGSPNLKYYVSVGADDDSLDVDTGAQMNVQYALLLQRDAQGDALFEIDSNNGLEADTPRTKLAVSNFTAIQRQVSTNNEGADLAAALFRGNSDTTLVNGIVLAPNNECIRIAGASTNGSAIATLNARSVVLTCNSTKFISSGGANAATSFGSGQNNNNDAFTSTLSSLFINGANETGVAASDPKTISSFFDTTTWIGAVRNSTDTWYAGWTCNSTTANFGTGTACTSLPTT